MSNVVTLGNIALDLVNEVSVRVVEELTGWDDAPSVRSGLQARAGQSGSWDGAGVHADRVVDIGGWVQELTSQAAYAVAHDLAGLRPGAVVDLIVFNTAIGLMSAQTRVTIGVKVEWINDRSFEYSVQVTAPDPVKYGALAFGTATLSAATPGAGLVYPLAYPLDFGVAPGVTPGAVPVGNVGTAPYHPVLRIDGPVLNPVVSLPESGAWVRYGGSLTVGQWLDINLRDRVVLLNAVVSMNTRITSYGDWLAVSPGGGSVAWTADTADPAARLSVTHFEGAWS